ncbi:MAG: hypothetical protein IT204_09205 [Fimbriimonadaceae bacterium]|nr:hypothetical protein [Fimbriimonadaceae bacterium]
MESRSSWQELATLAAGLFDDVGALQLAELELLLGVALQDQQLDNQERDVLRRVFDAIEEQAVEPACWQRIQVARQRHQL